MRNVLPEKLIRARLRTGRMASDDSYGFDGCFHIQGPSDRKLRIIAGTGLGWEHVSISLEMRAPNWDEMCFVKNLFWDEEETVVQYHPPKSQYVNIHPYCLHLWKQIGKEIDLPPKIMLG